MMKCFILSCFILLFNFSAYAQESNHLKFKNIPIDGNIIEFVSSLESSGYSKVRSLDNGYELYGSFAGEKCEIYVFCSPKTRVVTKVVLFAPKSESWYTLESDYNNYKEQFTVKYGKPTSSFEFFSSPYYEGDGYETQALRKDKCHYASYWEIDKGTIAVSISEYCQLKFVYEDKQNIEQAKKEKDNAILDEI